MTRHVPTTHLAGDILQPRTDGERRAYIDGFKQGVHLAIVYSRSASVDDAERLLDANIGLLERMGSEHG